SERAVQRVFYIRKRCVICHAVARAVSASFTKLRQRVIGTQKDLKRHLGDHLIVGSRNRIAIDPSGIHLVVAKPEIVLRVLLLPVEEGKQQHERRLKILSLLVGEYVEANWVRPGGKEMLAGPRVSLMDTFEVERRQSDLPQVVLALRALR